MQRERLQDEFTSTLNMFQQVQRSTASKEKEQVNKAKAQAYGEPHLRTLQRFWISLSSLLKLTFNITK